MRINVSTLFQVLVLIAQDVLAFEGKQSAGKSIQPLPSETPTTNNQTPVQ
ncbi:hypothetical protein [Nostoc sp.]